MIADEYQLAALAFEREHEQSRLTHALLGMAGEAGEAVSLIKHSENIDADELTDEIGDVVWYGATALAVVGRTLDHAMQWNLAKLGRRAKRGKDKPAELEMRRAFCPQPLAARLLIDMLVDHWEKSPNLRASLPKEMNNTIRLLRANAGRDPIHP